MPLGSNTGERDRARRLWDFDHPPLPATPDNYQRPWDAGNYAVLAAGPAVKVKVSGSFISPTAIKVRVGGAWVTPVAIKVRVSGSWVTL